VSLLATLIAGGTAWGAGFLATGKVNVGMACAATVVWMLIAIRAMGREDRG
jgi:hypothetical protein